VAEAKFRQFGKNDDGSIAFASRAPAYHEVADLIE